MERYVGRLNHLSNTGDVMAESRGKREDGLLKAEYSRVYSGGTAFHAAAQFGRALTSKELKLKTKAANIAGLQLADLLAHPLKRDVLRQNGKISDGPKGFEAELLKIAIKKYNRWIGTQRIDGYGRILV